MNISSLDISKDLPAAQKIAESSFATTSDASLSEWFSFEEMTKAIEEKRGICLIAKSDSAEPHGVIYAQQESLVNGKEGREKWVIVLAAVHPDATGSGVGSALLKEMEKQAKARGAVKMFVYTNKDDARVINFYRKNGYEDAGSIRDYQYGKDNSAVFLLKYL